MQSVCAIVAPDVMQQVVNMRATMSEEPSIGRIYDPPFAHFTLQLAEDYDWDGLEAALAAFARTWQPFAMHTTGLQVFTGPQADMVLAPYKDRALTEFQAAVWEVVSPFATGQVPQFYHPDRWLPHVTVKRCGSDAESFGRAMARLAREQTAWTMTVDNVMVQHDPGKNSQTHYQRLYVTLGVGQRAASPAPQTNATILTCEAEDDGGRTVRVHTDAGQEVIERWSAPDLVRLTAAACSSPVHFPGARCLLDGDEVRLVVPNTPYPVVERQTSAAPA